MGGDHLLTRPDPSDLYPTPPHPYPPEFTHAPDPLALWSAAAVSTSRVTLGSSTFNAPWYNPVQLARSLTTIDAMSRGRLQVGLGSSWMRDEYTVSGVEWSTRGRRLDEMAEFLKRWWTDNPVEFHGEFVDLPESVVDLRPHSPGGPPLYFGGFTIAPMHRIGRIGDGWLAADGPPEEFQALQWETARTAARQAGRDPDRLRRVIRLNPPAGTPVDAVAKRLRDLEQQGWDEALVELMFIAAGSDPLEIAAALHTQWLER